MIELYRTIISYDCNEDSLLNIKYYNMLPYFIAIFKKNSDAMGACLQKLFTQLSKDINFLNQNSYENAKKEQTEIIKCFLKIAKQSGDACLIYKEPLQQELTHIVKQKYLRKKEIKQSNKVLFYNICLAFKCFLFVCFF